MFYKARRTARSAPRPRPTSKPAAASNGSHAPSDVEATLLRQIDSALELLVSGSLRRADEAAERGEYEEALAWLQTVDSETLPTAYELKRASWLRALSAP